MRQKPPTDTPASCSVFDSMVTPDWPRIWDRIGTCRQHTAECDDAESYMQLVASNDGDMFLTLDRGRNQHCMHPSFRARTFCGGGHHDRVRLALAMLALAIAEDCEQQSEP